MAGSGLFGTDLRHSYASDAGTVGVAVYKVSACRNFHISRNDDKLVPEEFLARIEAVAADIWAHAVGFAAVVAFVAVGSPDTATKDITRTPQIILLIIEGSSTALNPCGPIFIEGSTRGPEAHSSSSRPWSRTS